MKWQFWQKKEVDFAIPADVRAALESQFRPDPELMSRLQCAQWVKNSAGKSVRYVRVFDPTLIEGHIDQKSGSIYISDRRPMSKRTPNGSGAGAAPESKTQSRGVKAV